MAVLTQEKMAERSATIRKEGKTVVFTNGCFDLIHLGHVELLNRAREEGDHLFVGINSDDSVCRLKGIGRPIQPAEDRAIILDSLATVSHVTIFEENTPEDLIHMIRPHVLVKGKDYKEDEVVGANLVRSWGGRVVRVSLVENRGTQQIVERILAGARREIP
ncbi:MAG: D-glycero-beta-D-manno-heptose 1-phosphate adenylyltransferase [Candidatus Neomarinimicrobiota bacterium]